MTTAVPARWFTRFSAALRLSAAAVSVVLLLIFLPREMGETRWLICWDVAAIVYLVLAWVIMARANAKYTRQHVISQDQSGYIIFLFVVLAACAGLVSIGFMVSSLKGLDFWPRTGRLTLAVLALVSAWLLIHTVFAFHYARLFYTRLQALEKSRESKGMARQPEPKEADVDLQFPGGDEPDYLDFAYYAFVVGMTSQVSDVTTNSRRMRRLTLMHSILSFIFNIAVVALSINIIASAI